MMKKGFFVMAAVFFSIHLQAQEDSTIQLMDEAVVTATKFERKQSQTGKVVSVINKEQLEKSYGKSVAQVLSEQAGVTVNGSLNAPGTVQTIYMRGASAGRILVLVDGIPVGDPSMISNEFDLNFISIHDVERIEILKGAQSTLYGSDAIAGAINIITVKKDIQRPFQAKLTSIRGNKGYTRDYASFYGKFKSLEYTVRNSFIKTKGFSSVYDSTGVNDFDKDGYKGRNTDLSLKYKFSASVAANVFFRQSDYKADIDAKSFTDEKDYYIKNRSGQAGAGIHYKKGKGEIKANYLFGKGNRTYRNDSSFVNPFGIKYEDNNLKNRSHYAELYGNYNLSVNFSLIAGIDFRESMMSQEYYALSSFGPYASSFGDTSFNQLSAFASVLFNSTNKKLNIEIGGRFNDHSRYGNNATYTFNPSYSINQHWRIFGSIASGYKAPSLYQLFDAFSGNPGLEPEKSTNYEAGIQLLGKKLSTRLVYFHRSIQNGIDFNYTTFKYFNFTKQNVNGLEFELSAPLAKKLNISTNYSLLAGKETTQSRKDFADTTYDYFLRRPRHSINFTAGYRPVEKLFASVSLRSVSKRYDSGGFMADDVELDRYILLNAYAEYKWKKLKFFTDLQNITGKKFFDVWGYNSIPFMFSIGLSFGF